VVSGVIVVSDFLSSFFSVTFSVQWGDFCLQQYRRASSVASLDNLKQILPTVDYIFISDGKKSKKELKDIVPSYLLDKIIYTEETLYKGVNLK
jgi:hypothetical protein